MHSHRKAKAHVHAAGVMLDGLVDELGKPAELDDLAGDVGDLLARQTKDRAVERDVLATTHVGVEARAELDQ